MRYLLSDLTITENPVDYIIDLIKVNFVLDVAQFPSMGIGVHRRVSSANKTVAMDVIASDVTSFISKLVGQGFNVSLQNIEMDGSAFVITMRYEGETFNFTLE
jgi:heptaprenylglyceryl phosphate synthase